MSMRYGRATGWSAAVAVVLGLSTSAHAEGNPATGASLFATHCSECHSMREGKDKKGPSLFNIVGRPAAANPSFAYSDALRHSGLTWTPDVLDAYVTLPAKKVPGGKMKYDGLPSPTERADLLAYLAHPSK